jgi:hypothetical protein
VKVYRNGTAIDTDQNQVHVDYFPPNENFDLHGCTVTVHGQLVTIELGITNGETEIEFNGASVNLAVLIPDIPALQNSVSCFLFINSWEPTPTNITAWIEKGQDLEVPRTLLNLRAPIGTKITANQAYYGSITYVGVPPPPNGEIIGDEPSSN